MLLELAFNLHDKRPSEAPCRKEVPWSFRWGGTPRCEHHFPGRCTRHRAERSSIWSFDVPADGIGAAA